MRYVFGAFEFSDTDDQIYCDGKPVRARPKLTRLLHYLIDHRSQLVTRKELLDHLWPDVRVGKTSLSTLINEARQLLGDSGEQQEIIRTESRRGYRFVADMVIQPRLSQWNEADKSLHRNLQSTLRVGQSAIRNGDLSTARRCFDSALKISRAASENPFWPLHRSD